MIYNNDLQQCIDFLTSILAIMLIAPNFASSNYMLSLYIFENLLPVCQLYLTESPLFDSLNVYALFIRKLIILLVLDFLKDFSEF